MPDCPHCRRYREELDELRERLRQREQVSGLSLANELMGPWGLTRQQARLVEALVAGEGRVVSRASLGWAISPRPEELHEKHLDVVVCHVRRKLGRDAIRTFNGAGYAMPVEARARVLSRIGASVVS